MNLDSKRFCHTVLPLTLALLFALTAVAQQVQPQNPPPPPGVQQEQKQSAEPGERKITDAEAQELFKSFDEILKFASQDTGLPIKSPVKHKIVGRDEVENFMLQRMKEDPDAQRLERGETSLKKLGLIPKDMDLRSYLIALLKEQVAGFYDAKTKVMYLLDWVEPEAQKPVLAHELTHALQDQNYDLEKWGQVSDKKLNNYDEMVRDEQRAARQAVVEGQATVVLVDYLLQPYGKSVATAPEVVEVLKKQMVSGGSTPLFSKAPMFLKQALLFPYDAGFDFERALLLAGGKVQAYSAALSNPPQDTSQILQPRTYIDQKQYPLPKLPDFNGVLGKSFERFDDGGFGEFDLQILVNQWAPPAEDSTPQSEVAAAAAASSGNTRNARLIHAWRGGYYVSFKKDSAEKAPIAMVFLMHLATSGDTKAFESIYRSGLKMRYKSLRMKSPSMIETEEGPITINSDGEWFTATEGFEEAQSQKLRATMLSVAKQTPTTSTKAAAVQ
jgi:hypothetical protein